MSRYIEFPVLADGTGIVVEVDDLAAGVVPVGIEPGQVARTASGAFEAALDKIRPVASAALATIRNQADPPDEFAIDFGIKFSADFGAVVAKTGSEANLHVVLKWSRSAHPSSNGRAQVQLPTGGGADG